MATMIIEGDRTKAASGKTYEVRNPATGEVVDEVPAGGSADVDKVAPAIAAGNTVVLKPASTTPLATLLCIEALIEGGLPEGVVNVVLGQATGEAIVAHPLIRKIALTGSTPTGKSVMAKASENLKKVTLELGGSDPCIVLDDADLEGAARAISVGRFFNCGQQCLSTKRLFVQEGAYDGLMEKLVARASKLKPGNGLDKDSRMGPMHTETQRAEVEAQLKDALDRGAKVVYGGGRPTGSEYDRGWFIEPTIVGEVPDDSRMWKEEVFGPALPVRKIKDLDEGLRLANDTQFGLGSSIWTANMAAAHRAVQELEAGYTWVHSIVIAHDELPFGGTKQSGFGKEHGVEAFLQYTEEKSVVYGGI